MLRQGAAVLLAATPPSEARRRALPCPTSRRLAGDMAEHRKTKCFTRRMVGLRDGAREVADASDVGSALGHRDRAAGVEKVERMGCLEDHLVTRQRQLCLEQALRFRFEEREELEELRRIALFEVVGGLLDL